MKKAISLMLICCLAIAMIPTYSFAAGTTPFNDVPSNAWYAGSVQYVYDNGLMVGTSDTKFGPGITTTRGMIVTIIHRMEGMPSASGSTFSDVPAGKWFTNAVTWANANNIVSGYGNGRFGPNDTITREQMATIMYRYASFKEYEVTDTGNLAQFRDSEKVSGWARTALSWANGAGLISGKGNGIVDPNGSATRAEAAAILTRFLKNNVDEDESFDPATDADYYIDDDLYSSAPLNENIVTNSSTGIQYVNNELILHTASGVSRASIVSLCKSHEGEIVGEITDTGTYQVRFSTPYSYGSLTSLKTTLESSSLVSWASINLVSEELFDYYPTSDTKWKSEWDNSTPAGLNWGVEAIHAPEAWDYRSRMSSVNVGVYDNVFFDHEDLTYKDRYFNHPNALSGGAVAHGTHVSGTIAAGFDNNKGISGIVPKATLYAFSAASSSAVLSRNYLMRYEIALTILLHEDKCKVVNFSQNTGRLECFAASHNDTNAINMITESANELGRYLKILLDLGDDFVLCVAAGNVNNIQYIENKSATYGYSDYSGVGTPVSGGALAKYNNYLNAIALSDIRSRIIVVGACGNSGSGKYTYSSFSNIGDRVDVVAPGEDICSTVSNNSYEHAGWSGTSMATPHVTGLAAMLFAVNPDLTGEQVKQIIVDTAKTVVSGTDKKMINAKLAVEEAIKRKENSSSNIDLLDGYWESIVQSRKIYKFYSDGTVQEYDIEPLQVISSSTLHASKKLRYSLNGTTLTLIYSDGFTTVLKWVSKSDNYDWDTGIAYHLPDNERFFYEAGWVRTDPAGNAMYLAKVRADKNENNATNPRDAYSAVLESYPKATKHDYQISGQTKSYDVDTEYALYDIDKDNVPELIIKLDGRKYYIYTYKNNQVEKCKFDYMDYASWSYNPPIYQFSGKGMLVHDGGMGNLHVEYVTLYSLNGNNIEFSANMVEAAGEYRDIINYLANCTPIIFYNLNDDAWFDQLKMLFANTYW